MKKESLKLKSLFFENQDKANAVAMKNYMRGQFAYFGIKAGLRRELSRHFITQMREYDLATQIECCKEIWLWPQREFQMTALDLLIKNKNLMEPKHLPDVRWFILTKSWWDTVDALAAHVLGALLRKNPELKNTMDKWIEDKNFWLVRSAILYQLKFKNHLNWSQLKHYILKHSSTQEFFLQKAMGWILREYSKTNAQRVAKFITQNKSKLPKLSQREGMKWINSHEL